MRLPDDGGRDGLGEATPVAAVARAWTDSDPLASISNRVTGSISSRSASFDIGSVVLTSIQLASEPGSGTLLPSAGRGPVRLD
jgi:hypothetical protein